MNCFNQRLIVFLCVALCSGSAWSQFSNYFEIHAAAMAEVNSQIYELNSEKKPRGAIEIATKALGNLAQQSSVIPEYSSAHVFEVRFDDAISAGLKSKLNSSDIFNFQLLSEASKQQVLIGLEQKYSSYFFRMALQMKRFKFHHAYALALSLKYGSADAAAEAKALAEIVSTLAQPFLLKNSSSGVTYIFDLADILNASISKSEISTEFASINSRLTDLYVEIANESKSPIFLALRASKKPNALINKLFAEIQFKKIGLYKAIMATEGNKQHAN